MKRLRIFAAAAAAVVALVFPVSASAYFYNQQWVDAPIRTEGVFRFAELSDGTVALTGYTDDPDNDPDGNNTASELTVPEQLGGRNVSVIADNVFSGNNRLSAVVLPDTVKVIGCNSFSNCDSLRSVTLPSSLTKIGKSAFAGCEKLSDIKLPPNLRNFGSHAFYGTGWLEKMKNTNPLVTVNSVLIDGTACSGNIVVPVGTLRIAPGAFYGADKLTAVTLPGGLMEIPADTFGCCRSLESISLPNGLRFIGDSAFENCLSLKKITIPDSVTTIGFDAFKGCDLIKSITVPESVVIIMPWAFGYSSTDDPISGFTLYCESTSAAVKYAKDNKLSYKTPSDSSGAEDKTPSEPRPIVSVLAVAAILLGVAGGIVIILKERVKKT